MPQLALIVGIMLATVLAVGAGARLKLPYPVLMVLLTVGVAFIPGFPKAAIPAHLILPLFLPPLLYAAAIKTSWSMFRVRWRSVALMAVALICVTVAAVAGAAWLLIPSIGIPAAVALGAVVAPPDPIAVEAVAGGVAIPRRLLTMLQSEGLFNDAASIVIFQAAIGAVVAGHGFNASVALQFLIGVAVAVAVGFVGGWLADQIGRFVGSPIGRSAITLVVPFAVYIGSDALHGSGVIAVVVAALEVRRTASVQEADERVTSRAFWEVLQLLVTGLAFGLVGLEMRQVIVSAGDRLWSMLAAAGIICGVIVLVRAVWMSALMLANRFRPGEDPPSSGRDALLLTWSGMRGLVTLALALALPVTLEDGSPFPARAEIIVTACAVLVVTLVIPGLTLRALVHVTGAAEPTTARHDETTAVAGRAQDAAMSAMKDAAKMTNLSPEQADELRREISSLREKLSEEHKERVPEAADAREAVMEAHAMALDAARREVLAARSEPGVDPEVADRVLRRLDLRTLLLDDSRKTRGSQQDST